MTFPFRRHKRNPTAREAREFATIIRSSEVRGPRFQGTSTLEEIRAAQARRRARRAAAEGNGEA